MNRKLILSLAVLTILFVFAAAVSGCGSKKAALPTKVVSTNIDKKPTKDSRKNTTGVPFAELKYIISSAPASSKIEGNTPWEVSPGGIYTATIEGKGDKAQEEGYAQIVIKNIKSGELKRLTMENQEKVQLTAKNLEWIDDANLFVIIGYPFGTVTMGGKIYKINIITGKTSLYLNTANSKEEYTEVHKSGSTFTFEKYVYDDDNFIKGHIEKGNLELK
jgi:hypothetical protein